MTNWQPKKTPTKGDLTYERLRADILWGRLPGNEILLERELCETYETGRAPMRYALARSIEAGLINVKARQGYVVKTLSLADAQEILFLRAILEEAAIVRACETMSQQEISDLRNLAKQSNLGPEGRVDGVRLTETNRDFHLAIAAAMRNERASRLLLNLLEQMFRVLVHVSDTRQEYEIIERHVALVDAISTRDPETARRALAVELEASRTRILQAF